MPRRPYRIGVLNDAWAANHPTVEGLKAGLRDLGFQEGRDLIFDVRFTKGKSAGDAGRAVALVKSGVDLLFTSDEGRPARPRRRPRRSLSCSRLSGIP